MGWINFETIRLHCPLFDDKFVGCEAFEGLKASGEIIGIDEVRQVLRELVVAVIVIAFNSGFLDGSVHPFNLTVGPWVFDFGQPVLDVRTRRQIGDSGALFSLGHCLRVDPVAPGQNPHALLTILYCSTDCLCRGGAPE